MEIQSALASGMCGAGHAVARWPRVVFMFGAMTCLFVSAAAHLLASHTRRFNRLFSQLNYAGYGELFSRYTDDLDFQFRRIEDFKPVALPKSDYDLSEKDQHAFFCQFYNMYFGQSAGGRFTGKKIANKILNKKELEFYKWEGTLSDLLQNVREKHYQVASTILEQSSQQHPSMCGRNYNQLNHRSKSSF
ncbi:hypothetical protein ZWY2020_014197 [Hordeum vulgare]|nr:hypothetical protein ZWY2020_014197 [Hordeum vulgare]